MENKKTSDEVVQELFNIVQTKRAEIAKIEKPNWITNGSFRFSDNIASSFNLQVVSDERELVRALAFLILHEKAYNEASGQLGVTSKFEWFGYSLEDWKSDFKTRINKIQVSSKKKELSNLEARLDKLISPELRIELELAEIRKALQ